MLLVFVVLFRDPYTCRGHEDPVNAIEVVENVVFSGCRAGVVRAWSTVTNDCLCIYSGHTGAAIPAA